MPPLPPPKPFHGLKPCAGQHEHFKVQIKRGPEGQLLEFKARLVAMGFTQVEGVDYFDTFASVMTTKSLLQPRVGFKTWNWGEKNVFI